MLSLVSFGKTYTQLPLYIEVEGTCIICSKYLNLVILYLRFRGSRENILLDISGYFVIFEFDIEGVDCKLNWKSFN